MDAIKDQAVYVIATVTPAKGKEARSKELLALQAAQVKANEKGNSRYEFFEKVNEAGENVIVVEETYDNIQAFEAHGKTEYVKKLVELSLAEDLFTEPFDPNTHVKVTSGQPNGGSSSSSS